MLIKVTFISITRFINIFWEWTVPLSNQVLLTYGASAQLAIYGSELFHYLRGTITIWVDMDSKLFARFANIVVQWTWHGLNLDGNPRVDSYRFVQIVVAWIIVDSRKIHRTVRINYWNWKQNVRNYSNPVIEYPTECKGMVKLNASLTMATWFCRVC